MYRVDVPCIVPCTRGAHVLPARATQRWQPARRKLPSGFALLRDRVRDDDVGWAPVGYDQTPGSTRLPVGSAAGLGAALLWVVGG